MPEDTDRILTPDEFIALQKTGAKFGTRRNTALNKLGSVDIYSNATDAIAVVRFAKIDADICQEIAPLLAAERAKITAAAAE